MKKFPFAVILVLAAGCATLSPLPPQKAATTTELSQCAGLAAGSSEKLLCLYEARAVQSDAKQKELEAKIAVLERRQPEQRGAVIAPPVLAVNAFGRIQPMLVQTEPTTSQPPSGQGIVIEHINWAIQGWDDTLVACVVRTNGPQQVNGAGVAQIYLDPDGQGVSPMPRACARSSSAIYIADVPPGERITIQYARPVPGYVLAGHAVYKPVVTRQYDWVGVGWKRYGGNEGTSIQF